MANRERGERSIEINGKTYTLVLDIDAMCALEDLFSTPEKEMSFGDVMARAERGSIRHLRGIWWATLRRHHPEMSLTDASALVQEMGGLAGMQARLLEVAKASQPDEQDVPKGRKKDPR